jgi:hypothetical protein
MCVTLTAATSFAPAQAHNASDSFYGRVVAERSGIAQKVTARESAKEASAFLQRPEGRNVVLIFLDTTCASR